MTKIQDHRQVSTSFRTRRNQKYRLHHIRRLVRLILLLLLLLGCSRSSEQTEKETTVLTSFLPVYLFTQQVTSGIKGITVKLLVPPSTGCPHNVALSPGDLHKLYEADIIVIHGLEIDQFLTDELLQSMTRDENIPRIVLADAILDSVTRLVPWTNLPRNIMPGYRPPGRVPVYRGGEQLHARRRLVVPPNPHAWVSPVRAAQEVRFLSQHLAKLLPNHARKLKSQGENFAVRLDYLAGEFQALAKAKNHPAFVSVHDTYAWFAHDLGFRLIGVVESKPGVEPGPQELNRLIELIRREKPFALVTEPQVHTNLAGMISRETGVPIVKLDPVNTGDPSGPGYIARMENNLNALREALEREIQ